MEKSATSRILGFVISLILTLIAFSFVLFPDFYTIQPKTLVYAVLSLALAQFVVQSIFFLNILQEKGPKWNLLVFFSTLGIIFIIIVCSIWIMNHLNYNMMPKM